MSAARCTCVPPLVMLDCPVHGDEVRALAAKAIDEGVRRRCDECAQAAEGGDHAER